MSPESTYEPRPIAVTSRPVAADEQVRHGHGILTDYASGQRVREADGGDPLYVMGVDVAGSGTILMIDPATGKLVPWQR
jgi:hypothetical protein